MGILLASFSLVVLDMAHPSLAPPWVLLYLLLIRICPKVTNIAHQGPLWPCHLLMFVHFIIMDVYSLLP
ncbi:hypothetical protein NC652_030366 [Populus alba x Populus x berolinensis]|nr:hypothetical protein NC652_030366 [Populus alba x Populus x berolinensis]